MIRRYLMRIAIVVLVIIAVLAGVVWLKPGQTDGEKWRFYRIAQTSYASSGITSDLQFARAGGSLTIDSVASLPGNLAFLPKKATLPLFGQTGPIPNAPVDVILEPEKCLFVRRVQFSPPPASGGGEPRMLLTLDPVSRAVLPSARLRAIMPPPCATSYGPECLIDIWVEARPKKCN